MAGSSAVTILFFGQNFGLSPLELQPFLVLLVFLGLSYSVFKLMLNLFELGSALLKRGKSLRGRRRKA